MTDVCTDSTRIGQTDLCIHVGAVHVDLAALFMDQGADLADGGLEHAMRRGIGDHQRGEVRRIISMRKANEREIEKFAQALD